ncbi:MAG TPA: 2-dehydropantoate 2-reductase [Acidimicrobiales bacterium]
MRIVVFGAGAIGGVIGARLFQHDCDVTLVAREDNFRALSRSGLRLETRDEAVTLRVPVVENLSDVALNADDVVILTVKSQDTRGALTDLADSVPPGVGIVCAQNGVENERVALRMFENVYGVCVMCPATHLNPGVVQANSSPITGLLDIGLWPRGHDERAVALAAALNDATFQSIVRDDIARWKWGKLLLNLNNAVQAICGTDEPATELSRRAVKEGMDVLDAAGIDFVGSEEDRARRGELLTTSSPGTMKRGGGSTWQSLVRGTGTVETDYITGEIVLRGRLCGVATPVNELLQRLANEMAREHRPPGAATEAQVLAQLEANAAS